MTTERIEKYLRSRGLTPDRAQAAAGLVAPLVQGYLDAIAACPHRPDKARHQRSPFPDIDAEFAATAVPTPTRLIETHDDSAVLLCLDALGIERPWRILLDGGHEASDISVSFRTMLTSQFVEGTGGLVAYLNDPRGRGGSASESWLETFLERETDRRVCGRCSGRWIDLLAERYVRFLAVEDDRRAAMMEPYLRLLAPYVACVGLTAGGDLVFRCR
jgi:hypothetical protein